MSSPYNRLSPHFLLHEFDERTGLAVPARAIPSVRRLCLSVLEPMRARFGVCTVNSGFRSVAYNRSVGGAPQSRHLYVKFESTPAADVRFDKGTPEEWAALAIRLAVGGVGLYDTHVHVDQRRTRARW